MLPAILIGFGAALFIAGTIWNYIIANPENVESEPVLVSAKIAIPFPRLKVQLVPEQINGEDLDYHFSVENIGPGDVDLKLTRYYVQGFSAGVGGSPGPQFIPQGGILNLYMPDINRLIKHRFVSLEISFVKSGTFDAHTSYYRFVLPSGTLSNPVNPIEWGETNGNSLSRAGPEMITAQFKQPLGGLQVALRDKNAKGQPNILVAEAEGRLLQFDPLAKTLFFAASTSTTARTVFGYFPERSDGLYVVVLQWDDRAKTQMAVVNEKLIDGSTGVK